MIASLSGTVVALEQGSAVVDVSGVGYLVQITGTTSGQLRLNEAVNLFTSLIVREDSFTLFGFNEIAEQRLFDLLRSVSGVGPKSALAILGALSVDQIIDAVASENDSAFKAVTGVGPKTAKLIGVTLAGKLGPSTGGAVASSNPAQATVMAALVGLGWNERNAKDAVGAAIKVLGAAAGENELLKFSLAQLGASKSIGATDE